MAPHQLFWTVPGWHKYSKCLVFSDKMMEFTAWGSDLIILTKWRNEYSILHSNIFLWYPKSILLVSLPHRNFHVFQTVRCQTSVKAKATHLSSFIWLWCQRKQWGEVIMETNCPRDNQAMTNGPIRLTLHDLDPDRPRVCLTPCVSYHPWEMEGTWVLTNIVQWCCTLNFSFQFTIFSTWKFVKDWENRKES